jgi:hypothetical protein
MGSGNDDVQMHFLEVGGDASIDLGAGNDRLTAMGTVHGDFTVRGAAGSDSLILGGETRPERSIRMVGNPFWIPPLDGGDPVSTMELGAGGPLVVQGRNFTIETGGGDFLNLQHTRAGIISIDSGETTSPEFIRIRDVAAWKLDLDTGGGNDIVNAALMTTRVGLRTDLGEGDNLLSLAIVAHEGDTNEVDGREVATFLSGGGRDTIALAGVRFAFAAEIDSGAGDDLVSVVASLWSGEIGQRVSTIDTGEGHDAVRAEYSHIARLRVDTQGGDDTVAVRVTATDELFADLGAGNDFREVYGSHLRGLATADGGAGFDTLNRLHSRIRQFNATNFEAGNDAGLLFS